MFYSYAGAWNSSLPQAALCGLRKAWVVVAGSSSDLGQGTGLPFHHWHTSRALSTKAVSSEPNLRLTCPLQA